MSMDYTVVQAVRQHFGDGSYNNMSDQQLPPEVRLEGREKSFPFSCQNVDKSKVAVLQFQIVGSNGAGSMKINGANISGGIPDSVSTTHQHRRPPLATEFYAVTNNITTSQIMLIPANVLDSDNILQIEASADDFIIDNIVVMYKTRNRSLPTG